MIVGDHEEGQGSMSEIDMKAWAESFRRRGWEGTAQLLESGEEATPAAYEEPPELPELLACARKWVRFAKAGERDARPAGTRCLR